MEEIKKVDQKDNENDKIIIIEQGKENNDLNEKNKESDKEKLLLEEFDSDNSAISNSDLSDNESDVKKQTSKNKLMNSEEFYQQNRQYFIMADGGAPIYTRYGDEVKNCSIHATFSAIIARFSILFDNKPNEESLNYIKNECSIMVFLKKGKIYIMGISNKNDSVSFLYNQLELLYHQLLSIATNDRIHIFEDKPSTFSKLIEDSNHLFEQLIEYTSHSMLGLLKSFQVLPVENRNKLNEICSKYRGENLLIGLISQNDNEILSISKSNSIELKYEDVILMQCIIMSDEKKKDNEIWMPICLPGISADGVLQFYCNISLNNQYGIFCLTEKNESTTIDQYTELSNKIYNEIKEKGFLANIEKALENRNNEELANEEIQVNSANNMKNLLKRTFTQKTDDALDSVNPKEVVNRNMTLTDLYFSSSNTVTEKKSRIGLLSKFTTKQNSLKAAFVKFNCGIVKNKISSQFLTVNLHSYNKMNKNEKYILKSYIKLYDAYLNLKQDSINQDNYFEIMKDYKFSHGIFINETYVLFGTFDLFKPNDEIFDIFKESVKLVKQNETNLFISIK